MTFSEKTHTELTAMLRMASSILATAQKVINNGPEQWSMPEIEKMLAETAALVSTAAMLVDESYMHTTISEDLDG
tara:strand:- start:814 stop:1038 length:225 start_codon:yes stop_codon:yes gene_type:complete